MTLRSHSSPRNPQDALARDEALAATLVKPIQTQFRQELRRVLRDHQDVRVGEWETVLGEAWVDIGQAVFRPTFADLADLEDDKRTSQELVALIARLIEDGQGARTIGRFIDEAAQGVVTTTRKRIQTVLRRVHRPSDIREVSRALRRLYRTEFVNKRAQRIALDTALRATAVYEHAAVLLAREVTGRDYVKVWRNQGDDRVRKSHGKEEPVPSVPLDQLFVLSSGVSLRFPRDPDGPDSETFGCRCWTEYQRV